MAALLLAAPCAARRKYGRGEPNMMKEFEPDILGPKLSRNLGALGCLVRFLRGRRKGAQKFQLRIVKFFEDSSSSRSYSKGGFHTVISEIPGGSAGTPGRQGGFLVNTSRPSPTKSAPCFVAPALRCSIAFSHPRFAAISLTHTKAFSDLISAK